MAGIKITDLTPLGEAAINDLLYIVDVSDTTQSPQGTSKQIEVGKMFSSGTYSPTISDGTNGIDANVNLATYIQVGNIVSVSALLEITLAAGETFGSFEIELPIASDFINEKECYGLIQYSFGSNILSEIVVASISAETTNNTCEVYLETATASINLAYVTIQFQYLIV